MEIHIVSTGGFRMEGTRLAVVAGGVAAAVVTALGTTGADTGSVGPPGTVPVAAALVPSPELTVLASAAPRDTLRASNRAW